MKILIRNLDREITEDSIKALFEAHGKVEACDLVIDKETNASKGFGFVEMPDDNEANAAIKALNGEKIERNVIRVKESEPAKQPLKKAQTSEKPSEYQLRTDRAARIWGGKK